MSLISLVIGNVFCMLPPLNAFRGKEADEPTRQGSQREASSGGDGAIATDLPVGVRSN